MEKMFYIGLAVILAVGLALCLFSCGKTDTSAGGTEQTSGDAIGAENKDTDTQTVAPDTEKQPSDPEPAGLLPFSKGININGMETFLSENRYGFFERGVRLVTTESTFTDIKAQGFDHVRIPVNFYTAYFEAPTGKYNYTTEDIMEYVDTAIELAIKNGLYVTLDFHGWFYIGEEEDDYEEFLYCWTQVADRYKDCSELLNFELLNEPWYSNGKAQTYLSDKRLNEMQAAAIKIIRDTGSNNSTRLIICCTADGNKAWKLDQLKLPEDENLAVAIHEYEPKAFTHQNFSWAGYGNQRTTLDDLGGFRKATDWDFGQIESFMKKTGIPVVLNEFGMNLAMSSEEDVKEYLGGVTDFCRENGIPWAYWQYYDEYNFEGSMSLFRKKSYFGSQEWDQTALDALFDR